MDSAPEEKNQSIALVASLLFIIAFAVLIYIFFTKFMIQPHSTELREGHRDADYCRMVKLYMDTNGREGWRDYRGIYYKDCLK
ncbi:hypothetical protein [Marinospirillum insulare]|uniref:Uncharacterized protein n=1 Tax=Marinospirillum insulare TaxID=217169 RepID=A0ABQ5ZZ60_9GAMM|nr:hypothetical protein [Marinospirillum insulare]GLR63288.1 hypothetical protein GCM10007878_07230 [Marinospirillum insulare]